ncbi:MAG: photosynthetic complex assembly protein PuhC [Pseudomonadota bacterium]
MAHGRTETGLYFDAERREMQRRDKEMIPKRLVYAMFGLAVSALAITSFAVITDRPQVGVPHDAPIVATHEVILEGEGNAAKVTTSAGEVLLDSEQGAFVTVIRSGLERARLVHRVEGNPPVTITQFESGRMSLFDPATGWQVELSSFGQGNKAHFTRLFSQ